MPALTAAIFAAAPAACAAMPDAAIEAVERGIVVRPDEKPLGATISGWMPGVPYVGGEVVKRANSSDRQVVQSGQQPSSS